LGGHGTNSFAGTHKYQIPFLCLYRTKDGRLTSILDFSSNLLNGL